jgi:hypothetical protein
MPSLQALWDDLNERQRTYLQALYECDQASEAERRDLAARGFYDRTPASEWRWQMYGPTEPPSPLYRKLYQAGLVDPGTGATWQALERRGLVECRTIGTVQLLQLQISPLGRKLVRAATREQPRPRPPKGQLRERQWAALARLYAAGDEGIHSEQMRHGFDWTRTLLRLRDYKPEPLLEEFHDPVVYIVGRMRLTTYGRSYYEQEWARYRELYPNVDAPAPTKD